MLVSQIVKNKGDMVFTVAPSESVGAVAALLHARRVGAMVVLDGDRITARGAVTGVREEGGARFADCDIWLEREPGDRPLIGTAVVRLPA